MCSNWTRWQMPAMASRAAQAESQPHPLPVAAAMSPTQVEEVRRQAWQEGLERGLREGRELGQAEMQEQARRLRGLADRLAQPLSPLDASIEEQLLELVIVLARQLARHEISLHPEHVLDIVREAMAALPAGSHRLTLHLHPEDARLVRQWLSDEPDQHWKIIESHSLQRGDCQLQTEHARIDERLDVRLERLISQLMPGVGEAGPHHQVHAA